MGAKRRSYRPHIKGGGGGVDVPLKGGEMGEVRGRLKPRRLCKLGIRAPFRCRQCFAVHSRSLLLRVWSAGCDVMTVVSTHTGRLIPMSNFLWLLSPEKLVSSFLLKYDVTELSRTQVEFKR